MRLLRYHGQSYADQLLEEDAALRAAGETVIEKQSGNHKGGS